MNKKRRHCILGDVLTDEERERLRVLFEQQSIRLNDKGIVARVKVPSDYAYCPYRFRIGAEVDYCTSKCQINRTALREATVGVA
jgi:hypothetical protein